MAKRQLDLEVLRKGRRQEEWQATGDPRNVSWAQSQLHNWLSSNGWHEGRWDEFELLAREQGGWKVLARVHA